MVLVGTITELTMETTMVSMVPTMERTTRTMVMGQLHIMQIMELLATILFRQAQSSTTRGSWHQDAGQEHPSGRHQPQDSCWGTDFGLKGQIHPDQVKGWKRIHCSI